MGISLAYNSTEGCDSLTHILKPLNPKPMNIITPNGNKFNTELPAKSNLLMVFTDNGTQVFDSLRLTGRFTIATEFLEPKAMIEVVHSFGTTEINEDFIWQ